MTSTGITVGVIGAGIAGLTCAQQLSEGGFDVAVLDKGRSPGGRTATRHTDAGNNFDHGAQYFTARDPNFQQRTSEWIERGVVAEWHGRIVRHENGIVTDTSPLPRYVGVPGMSAMAADLATGLRVHSRAQVVEVNQHADGWTVVTDQKTSMSFETLVVTLPSPQTAALLKDHPFAKSAALISMTPCWAVMVAFDERIDVPWDGAFVHNSPLSWVARNSSKPGRNPQTDSWVLHASADWSLAHLEQSPEEAAPQLLAAFENIAGRPLPASRFLQSHRWRYSLGSDPAERKTLVDRENRLIVCGDWLSGGRVEGAFLSGFDAAAKVQDVVRAS